MGQLLQKLAALLSVKTHTPIPFWLSLTVDDLFSWLDIISEITKERNE